MWRHPWLHIIITALISDKNPEGTLKNSDLELSTFFLHEATLLDTSPEAKTVAPRLGSNNKPTIYWITQEASTTNPVVAYFLRIHAIHSQQFFLNPSVFYHPGQENCMADDASRLFDLSDTPFIAHIPATYPQLQILWQLCPCHCNYFHA